MQFKLVKVNDAKVGEEDLQLLDEVSASSVLGEQPDSKSEHGPSAPLKTEQDLKISGSRERILGLLRSSASREPEQLYRPI